MKAWVSQRKGTPVQSLRFERDWPIPKPGPGDVLVKVHASALNPGGHKMMAMLPNIVRPFVAELDFVGTVVDGNGTQFNQGDRVLGTVPPFDFLRNKQGALAEYTSLPASEMMLCPSGMPIPQAAGMASAFWTGYQAIVEIAQLESGQTVFINGASSAIGAMAIQIAKARGVRVVGCASTRNEALVRSLGVDEFFDYTSRPLHEQLSTNPPSVKYHAFIECVGLIDPSLYLRCETFLAPGGLFISSGPSPSSLAVSELAQLGRTILEIVRPTWLGGVNRPYRLIRAHNAKQEYWDALGELYAKGQLRMPIDSEHRFEDVLEAYDIICSLHARGKVVIHVDDKAT